MGFDAIIRNGTVVTATDSYVADVAVIEGKIAAIGKDLPAENASRILDASGKLLLPGGIDVHTHLDMPFGGTTSADDFETGTRAAAFGGTTTLIDFAIQYKGQPLRQAFETWMSKASSKAVSDYAFHCIVTDVSGGQLSEMNDLVREGVTSFKLFMAYPGVFMLDDGSIFKALQMTSQEWRPGVHACRKRQRHRRHCAAGAGRGKESAEVPRSHAPDHGGGRGNWPRHCIGGNGGRADLHRAPQLQRCT